MSSSIEDRLKALREELKACIGTTNDMSKTSDQRIAAMRRIPEITAEMLDVQQEARDARIDELVATLAPINERLSAVLEELGRPISGRERGNPKRSNRPRS